MKHYCSRCGKKIDIPFKSKVEAILLKKINECSVCSKITLYERNEKHLLCSGFVEKDYIIVERFQSEYYDWINNNIGKRCAVLLRDGSYHVAILDKGNTGWVRLSGDEENEFPFFEVKKIQIFQQGDRRYEKPDGTYVLGYKGLIIDNGILESQNGYVYELGIPYQEEYKVPLTSDYQDAYSHFCLKIEDVIARRDYIGTTINGGSAGFNEYRLFRVKAEGHYFQYTQTGWVSNCLTVIDEVKQKEIIEYFKKNNKAYEILLRRLRDAQYKNPQEIWRRYQLSRVEEYRNDYSDEETLAICVKSAPFYGVGTECLAIDDIFACQKCYKLEACFKSYAYSKYCYLITRNRIKRFEPYENNEEYKYLLESKEDKAKVKGLQRLYQAYGTCGN